MEILGRIAGIAAAATIIAGAASAATYNIELANANSDGNKDGIRATLTCEACEVWYISELDYNNDDFDLGFFHVGDNTPGTVDGSIFNRDVLGDGSNDNGEGTRVDLMNTILGTSYMLGDRTETGGNESTWTSSASDIMVWIGNDQGFKYALIRNYAFDNTFMWVGEAQGGGGKSGYDGFGVVPLPAAGWLLIAGIGGLAAMRRRRRS